MSVQWYPGHMAKAKREMAERLKVVDVIVEMRDARIPAATGNPDLDDLAEGRDRIIVLNKADLADPDITGKWTGHLGKGEIHVVEMDSRTTKGVRQIKKTAVDYADRLALKLKQKGRRRRPARMMIVGVPNVGKSTLINQLSRRTAARTGNTPGVTRGQQWISVDKSLLLLDTPGLLWPKFDDPEVGMKLAATSAVSDKVVNSEELCLWLLRNLSTDYPELLSSYYNLDDIEDDMTLLLTAIGANRGCFLSGGRIDTERTSMVVLRDFRAGKLGRISLETPETVS